MANGGVWGVKGGRTGEAWERKEEQVIKIGRPTPKRTVHPLSFLNLNFCKLLKKKKAPAFHVPNL